MASERAKRLLLEMSRFNVVMGGKANNDQLAEIVDRELEGLVGAAQSHVTHDCETAHKCVLIEELKGWEVK